MKRLIIALLLSFACALSVFAQQTLTVSGTVKDDAGEPLIGVVVAVAGTGNAAVTDLDGNYTLTKVPAGAKLEASCLGYTNVTKPAAEKVDFVLSTSTEMLSEAVVTGMTTTDKRLFTGATDQLSAVDVNISGVGEVSRSLEGKSAGVSVQNVSGTFGTAPKIRVRGATSIFGDSKPLWVVDGVIMEDVVNVDANSLSSGDATTLISSAIAGLNSDDIESFQILKDGSATSIYGARAMAGVIVVTTKKGTPGVTRVNYNGEYTMMYQLMNKYDTATGKYLVENTEAGRKAYLRKAEMRNTDWFQELFRPTVQHSHSVSITSGSEKGSYYASLGALVDPGWSIQSKVNRYTALFNTSQKIFKDYITLNIIGNASYRQQRAPGSLASTTNVVEGSVKRDFDINPYSYALRTSRTLDPDEFYTRNYAPFNIKHELANNYIDLSVLDTKFQAEIKAKPIKGQFEPGRGLPCRSHEDHPEP